MSEETKTESAEVTEARDKAKTFPTRALAEAYQQAKRAGKGEVAAILKEELRRRR